MFPEGFAWGVSTAAHQIEGAAGRGPSIWDTFAAEPGRIADGSTAEVACDHIARYAEDVALMAGLGVNAYRFSISWPRVLAGGIGFYDRLIDALLAAGVDPVATLYHWDLPQSVHEAGGWLERDTADRFADYAGQVAGVLGDRVKLWITLNEPFVQTSLGYGLGTHAPGEELSFGALAVAHHLLLGHGRAVAALRAAGNVPVTIANNYSPAEDLDGSGTAQAYDAFHNRLFTDPLFGLGYPAPWHDLMPVEDGDLAVIAAPLDALGVNYYMPTGVRAPSPSDSLPFAIAPLEGYPTTAFGWPVVPHGLRTLLTTLHRRYEGTLPPIYITENGCSYGEKLDDTERIAYLGGHIQAVRDALADGVDVRGYFVWSLLDNFEWAEGYSQRFGLVDVDFDTQVRTPRASFRWYRSLIRGE